KAKMFGGGLVGLQYATIKQQLGPQLNGIINYDFWEPAKTLNFPGVDEFLKKYQARAASEGVDPLGWYLPPFAYANMQVLQQAIEGTKGVDQDKLADYIRSNTFKTVVGDVSYGQDGEWSKPRVLEVQFQNITGTWIELFKDLKTEVIVSPSEYKTGDVIAPYSEVKRQ